MFEITSLISSKEHTTWPPFNNPVEKTGDLAERPNSVYLLSNENRNSCANVIVQTTLNYPPHTDFQFLVAGSLPSLITA